MFFFLIYNFTLKSGKLLGFQFQISTTNWIIYIRRKAPYFLACYIVRCLEICRLLSKYIGLQLPFALAQYIGASELWKAGILCCTKGSESLQRKFTLFYPQFTSPMFKMPSFNNTNRKRPQIILDL